jgi:hypothetical protein
MTVTDYPLSQTVIPGMFRNPANKLYLLPHKFIKPIMEMTKLLARIKKYRWIRMPLIIVLGGLAGFAYYYFIGCRTGSCPISNNPYISTTYGALIGLLFSLGKRGKNNE